jgi:hypothetical protein
MVVEKDRFDPAQIAPGFSAMTGDVYHSMHNYNRAPLRDLPNDRPPVTTLTPEAVTTLVPFAAQSSYTSTELAELSALSASVTKALAQGTLPEPDKVSNSTKPGSGAPIDDDELHNRAADILRLLKARSGF